MSNSLEKDEDKAVSQNDHPDDEYTDQDFEAMQRLVVTEDYSGKNLDDLYVCVGDTVYMSPDEQSNNNWLWVHSPRLKCSGYIPKQITKSLEELEHAVI